MDKKLPTNFLYCKKKKINKDTKNIVTTCTSLKLQNLVYISLHKSGSVCQRVTHYNYSNFSCTTKYAL